MTIPARRPLTADEVEALSRDLPDWHVLDGALTRIETAPSFAAAIDWVRAVAEAAEAMDHHPDIDIRYRNVTFRCTTHDLAGLSTWDVELAGRIDTIIAS